MNLSPYAKAVVAVLGATIASAVIVLEDGVISPYDALVVASTFLTALGVYLVPNKP